MLGAINPKVRVVLGAILLAVGLVLHSILIGAIGGALLVLAAGRLVFNFRRGQQ
jgi:hypothetical protein